LIETVVSSKKFNFLDFFLSSKIRGDRLHHPEKSGRERVALVPPGPLASEDTDRCSWSTFVHRDDLMLWSEPACRFTQKGRNVRIKNASGMERDAHLRTSA
jgi:hypothetical protein